MNRPRRGASPMRRAFTEDLGLKLLALGASLSLFYLVRGAEDAQRSFFVEVVALLPDERAGRILVSDVPERVRLTLQGTRSVLNNLQREALGPLQMDLRDGSKDYFFFESEDLDLPLGVYVVQIAPSSVPLRWEDRTERRLPVRATLDGKARDGLETARTTVSPSEVRVAGPRSELERLTTLVTAPIDLSAFGAGSHTRRVDLDSPSPLVALPGDGTVEVTVDIRPEQASRTLPPAAVAAPGAPARTRFRPTRVRVTLVGPPRLVEPVEAERVIPYVDVPDTLAGSRDVPLPVRVRNVPEGVEVLVEPPEVLVALPR